MARVASQNPSYESKGYCYAIPKDQRRFRKRVHAFPIGTMGTSVQTLAFQPGSTPVVLEHVHRCRRDVPTALCTTLTHPVSL